MDEPAAQPKRPREARSPRLLDAMRAGTTKSLNATLLEQLRADLLRGVIGADVKLKIPDLCVQYEVSPGVAREALARLVSEGLVDFNDQRGFRTPRMSSAAIRDITRTRILVEREALADSMRNGTVAWEAQVLAAQHRLMRCVRDSSTREDAEEWTLRHKEFHFALISACSSPWLIKLHKIFYDQTERYRFISAKSDTNPRASRRDVNLEHDRIVKAVISRDVPRALDLVDEHLQRTAERVVAVMELGS